MTSPASEATLIGLPEASRRLGISKTTAHDLVRNGTFPVRAVKVGSRWKVNRQELEDFMAAR